MNMVELRSIDLSKTKIVCITTKGNVIVEHENNKVLVMKKMFNKACNNGGIVHDASIRPMPPNEKYNNVLYVLMTLQPW